MTSLAAEPRTAPAEPVAVPAIVDTVLDCGSTRIVLSLGIAGSGTPSPMGGGTYSVTDADGNGASGNCATGCESVTGKGACRTITVADAERRGVAREVVRSVPRSELPAMPVPGEMSATVGRTTHAINAGGGAGAECHLDRDHDDAVVGATCTDQGGEGGTTRTVVTIAPDGGCESVTAPASCTCVTGC